MVEGHECFRDQGQIPDASRENTDLIQLPRQAEHAAPGNQPVGGLESENPAIGGRADDGAVGLAADGERYHEGRHGRRRAARRTTGGAFRIVGIPRLSRGIDGKFGGHGLAKNDGPCFAQQRYHGGIHFRGASGVEDGAVLGGHVLGVENVLHPHREAVEGANRMTRSARRIRLARLPKSIIRVQMCPCLDRVLELIDAFETIANQSLGGYFAGTESRRRVRCIQSGQGHDRLRCFTFSARMVNCPFVRRYLPPYI